MVWLTSNFIALAAVVQNVLYVHIPSSNVKNIKAQLKTDSYSSNLWVPLYHRIVERITTFQTVLPDSRNHLYQYRLQVEFLNRSILISKDWITIGIGINVEFPETISSCQNGTTYNSTAIENSGSDSKCEFSYSYIIYISVITISVVFGILISKIIYNIGKSRCTLWFK